MEEACGEDGLEVEEGEVELDAVLEAEELAPVEVENEEALEAEDFVSEICPGVTVDGYWPDDDTWLPATVAEIYDDGSLRIIWEDSSQSDVPADYIRMAVDGDVMEPLTKRIRM